MPKRNVPRPAAVYGIDIGKNIFHVVGLGSDGVPVQKVRFRRDTLLQFFARAAPAIVGMESCAGSQWIARKIQALRHEVRLIPAQFVKPYVKSNKTDVIDAEASLRQPRDQRCGLLHSRARTSQSSGFAPGAGPDDRNENASDQSDASLLPRIRDRPTPGRRSVQARPATGSRGSIKRSFAGDA